MKGGYASVNQMRVFAAFSWGLAILSGLMPTDHSPQMNWRIPLMTIGFTVLYCAYASFLKKRWPSEMNRIADNYPGWTYYVGMTHGAVVLPALFCLSIYFHPNTFHISDFMYSQFWVEAWQISASSLCLEAALCAINAYLLKDYFIYPNGLEYAFVVHHIAGVIGCTLCLRFPAFAGAVAFNGAQSELGSSFYSFTTMVPITVLKYIYWCVMSLSNSVGFYIAYIIYNSSIPRAFANGYFSLACLLVLLRTGGLVIDIAAVFGSSGNSGKDLASLTESGKIVLDREGMNASTKCDDPVMASADKGKHPPMVRRVAVNMHKE